MTEQEINKIWNDFIPTLQYSEPALSDVIFQCKRCFIDPEIFHSNLFWLGSNLFVKVHHPETILYEPTESLLELLNYLPPRIH